MELLVILAFVLTGYFLYRKWKALRAYNRRLQPRIAMASESEMVEIDLSDWDEDEISSLGIFSGACDTIGDMGFDPTYEWDR